MLFETSNNCYLQLWSHYAERTVPNDVEMTFGKMTISEQLIDLAYGSSYSMSYKIVNSEEEDEDVDESTEDKFIGKIYYQLRDLDTGQTDNCEETTAQLHLYGKFNMQNGGYEVIEL